MANDDIILKDIASGKGLKPLNSPDNQSSGVTTEQRGQDSGIRIDLCAKQSSSTENGKKKEK